MTGPGRSQEVLKHLATAWGPLAVLLLVTATFYLTTRQYEASWDDALFLQRSPEMANPANLLKVFEVDFFGFTDNPTLAAGTPLYRPLPLGLLIVERGLFSTQMDGFRILHMGWHLVNIALMFLFARRMLGTDRVFGPFVASSVLAFMPYTVDTVLFLTSISDLMALCFVLLASICFLHWLDSPKPWRWVCVTLLSLGAMLCKESAVTLVVVLSAIYWCKREDSSRDRRAVTAILGVALVTGLFLWLRGTVHRQFDQDDCERQLAEGIPRTWRHICSQAKSVHTRLWARVGFQAADRVIRSPTGLDATVSQSRNRGPVRLEPPPRRSLP